MKWTENPGESENSTGPCLIGISSLTSIPKLCTRVLPNPLFLSPWVSDKAWGPHQSLAGRGPEHEGTGSTQTARAAWPFSAARAGPAQSPHPLATKSSQQEKGDWLRGTSQGGESAQVCSPRGMCATQRREGGEKGAGVEGGKEERKRREEAELKKVKRGRAQSPASCLMPTGGPQEGQPATWLQLVTLPLCMAHQPAHTLHRHTHHLCTHCLGICTPLTHIYAVCHASCPCRQVLSLCACV